MKIDSKYAYIITVTKMFDIHLMSYPPDPDVPDDTEAYYIGWPDDRDAGIMHGRLTASFSTLEALDDWCRSNLDRLEAFANIESIPDATEWL